MNKPVPEFSRIVNTARLSPSGVEENLEAKPEERKALAKRFDLIDLPSLKAQLMLIPGPQHSVTATGTIKADVIQRCVVTLEPVPSAIDLPVDIVFMPSENHPAGEIPTDLNELEDEVEFFKDGKIDIGEAVAQQLGVNLDLYPRKADACLGDAEFGEKVEKTKPFANLAAAVKAKKNKGSK